MAIAKNTVKLTIPHNKIMEYRHMRNIVTKLLLNFQGGEI